MLVFLQKSTTQLQTYHKLDEQAFIQNVKHLVEEHYGQLLSPALNQFQLDNKVSLFSNLMTDGLSKSSKLKHSRRKREVLHTSNELESIREEWEAISKKSDKTPEETEQAEELRKTLKHSIRRERRKGYEHLSTGANKTLTNKLIKVMSAPQKKDRIPAIEIKGKTIPSVPETLNVIANDIIGGVIPDASTPTTSRRAPLYPPSNTAEEYIQNSKISSTILSDHRMAKIFDSISNLSSTPGPDQLKYYHLRLTWNSTMEPIRSIYNDCLILGIVPSLWLDTKSFLIQKPGKSGKNTGDHRIISLTNTLWKTLGKLILLFLEHDLMINRQLHPHQYGFITGRGTDQAISALEDTQVHKEVCVLSC